MDYTSNTDPSAPGPTIKRGKNNKGDKKEDSSAAPRKSKNTAVFVTCLPIDAQADEVAARFGRFGLIMEDDEGKPKVKLYQTEDGRFSGEALVVYYKEESVELAVTLLDDAELRLGEPGTRMKVQRAEYGHKAAEGDAAVENIGQKRSVDKKKATKRIGNMERCVYTGSLFVFLANPLPGNSRTGTRMTNSGQLGQKSIHLAWLFSSICSLDKSYQRMQHCYSI